MTDDDETTEDETTEEQFESVGDRRVVGPMPVCRIAKPDARRRAVLERFREALKLPEQPQPTDDEED